MTQKSCIELRLDDHHLLTCILDMGQQSIHQNNNSLGPCSLGFFSSVQLGFKCTLDKAVIAHAYHGHTLQDKVSS